MREVITTFHYMSVADHWRENAWRHEAKGLWWIEQGYDDRAARSFKKALRNYRRAHEADHLFDLPSTGFAVVDDLLAQRIAAARKALTDFVARGLYATGSSGGGGLQSLID